MYPTSITIFACQWCSYTADLAGPERRSYPTNTNILRLPCKGRVDESLLLKGFENDADEVMVS